MATLENIFNPYERNRWHYIEDGEFLEVCPVIICNMDGNHEISKTKEIYVWKKKNKIVTKTIEENLKIKHYIKIGEECPICYDPIFHKNNAYLTECGHSFHKSCLMNYDYANHLVLKGIIWCPMCRGDMGLYGDSTEIYCNSKNDLDKLEDFWNNKQYKTPQACSSYNHFVGFNKNCYECIRFRKKGF